MKKLIFCFFIFLTIFKSIIFCEDLQIIYPNGGNKINFSSDFNISLNNNYNKEFKYLYKIIDIERGQIYILGSSSNKNFKVPKYFIKPSRKLRLQVEVSNQDTIFNLFSNNFFYILNDLVVNQSQNNINSNNTNNILIYPIPFKNYVTLNIGNFTNISKFQIYDLLGNEVLSYKVIDCSCKLFSIKTDFLRSGYYLFVVDDINGVKFSFNIFKQ